MLRISDDALPVRSLARGETATSHPVFARVRLNRTGVRLESGAVYSFVAIDAKGWRDWFLSTDPEGFERRSMRAFERWRRVRHARWFQLIGQIGDDPSTAFSIGGKLTGYIPANSGELLLYANDVSWAYWNNRGSLRLEIHREE